MPQTSRNSLQEPVTKLCLALDADRRTPEGRIRSEREFRNHFFPYDADMATDRIFKFLPNDVRGPVVSSWGIRGKKTAVRDNDEQVAAVVHDALLSDDIDDVIFEQGLSTEILVSWCDLRDWWTFWRRGAQTKHSIGLALQAAYDLQLFDARWFLDVLESGGLRGTDVLVEGLARPDLGTWIRRVHESGDGSPNGLVMALGWTTLVSHTPHAALLRVIDGVAQMRGLADSSVEGGTVSVLPSRTTDLTPPAETSEAATSAPASEPTSVRARPTVSTRAAAAVRSVSSKTKLG